MSTWFLSFLVGHLQNFFIVKKMDVANLPFSQETLSNLVFSKHVKISNNGSISISGKKRRVHENKKWWNLFLILQNCFTGKTVSGGKHKKYGIWQVNTRIYLRSWRIFWRKDTTNVSILLINCVVLHQSLWFASCRLVIWIYRKIMNLSRRL